MLLEDYFQEIRDLVSGHLIVLSANLIYEVRSRDRGFLKGELLLRGGLVLCVREFVTVRSIAIRDMYAYQCMNAENELIFRYDNTSNSKFRERRSCPLLTSPTSD